MKFQYIVLIMIISVVSATAGTFYLLKNDIAGEVIAFAEPTKEFTTKPVQILTNLKQDSRPRFVRAQISVGVNSEKGLKKLEENEVALKDLCIIQFNETTVE